MIFNQNIICLPLQQPSFQLMSQISLALLLKSSIFSQFLINKIKSYSVFFLNKLGSEPCFTLTLGSSVVEGTRFSVLTELLCSLQNCGVQIHWWSPAISVSDPPKHLPPPTKTTPSFLQLYSTKLKLYRGENMTVCWWYRVVVNGLLFSH